MMAQHVPHQAKDKRRVKVYELRNNDWFDRGTGFCTATFTTADDGQCRDPRVLVESEDQPERLLLDTSICKEDGFQKQRDTLIVWTEPSNGMDMALSFQEAEGCAMIWKFINSVQQSVLNGLGVGDDGLSDDLTMDLAATVSLPAAELGNLAEIETSIRIVSSTAAGRDALAKYIQKEDYVRKVIPLVDTAEDLESLSDLHRLCNIMKTIILLNDPAIIEYVVSDECVDAVVGALEYDPDFPCHKANHRQWLNGEGRFKEVVPIEDEHIRRKIHQTYRLQYLKDVVLARILDDPTFSVLNSLIFFNQVEIVQNLQANSGFLNELFGIVKSPTKDPQLRKDAVLFIQQCCSIAKNLQQAARQALYNNFLAHGLFQVINFGLRHPDVGVRVGATDILVSLIDYDPQMVRATIYRQLSENHPPLTDSLIDLLLVEVDLGVKSQISDALKVLLDGVPLAQVQEALARASGEFPGGARRSAMDPNPQQEVFLARFYEGSASKLFKPLLDLEGKERLTFTTQQASMFSYLIEILCFFIRQHYHRSKGFVLQKNLCQRIAQLLQSEEKYLRLVAIRFFRQLLALQDAFYVKHLIDKDVFGPILDALASALPRDNLLGSACLEFFEFIKKEGMKDLVRHLVQAHRPKLEALGELETFRDIMLRYDQTQGFTTGVPGESALDSEDEVVGAGAGRRPTGHMRMMEQLHVDPSEEDYWNGSDEEDEHHQAQQQLASAAGKTVLSNGSSPSLKHLVDYHSDGEDEDENEMEQSGGEVLPGMIPSTIAVGKEASPAEASSASTATSQPMDVTSNGIDKAHAGENTAARPTDDAAEPGGGETAPSPSPSPSPASSPLSSASAPPRLSEKRRREEDDDDDELGKMMQHKRRNSKSMAANASVTASSGATPQSLLKKKQSFSGSPGAAGGGPKIAISISSTSPGLRSKDES